MVLVPPFIEVDGLVVPLQCYQPTEGNSHLAGIGHAEQPRESKLAGFRYVIGELLEADPQEVLEALNEKRALPLPQEIWAAPILPEHGDDDEYAKHIESWERLTGYSPDLSDAYTVGASFIRTRLVIPRSTFIKLMTRLYELDHAVREGRMEPRIDESIPVPPLPPPPRERKAWSDDELRELEEAAAALDDMDPLQTSPAPDPYGTRSIENRRAFLFAMLEVAYLRTEQGDDLVPPRLRQLELPALVAYDDALIALQAYLRDPARAAIVDPEVEWAKRHAEPSASGSGTGFDLATAAGLPLTPFEADVSIDLFRLPTPLRPAGLSSHLWIAHCEAAFVRLRITRAAAQDDVPNTVLTRVLGHQVALRYRPELTPVMRLWRIDLLG